MENKINGICPNCERLICSCKKIIINEEQKDFLIGLLENTKENLEINESMEFGDILNEILEILNKNE